MEKEIQQLLGQAKQTIEASVTQGVQMALESFTVRLNGILSNVGNGFLEIAKKDKVEAEALKDTQTGNS